MHLSIAHKVFYPLFLFRKVIVEIETSLSLLIATACLFFKRLYRFTKFLFWSFGSCRLGRNISMAVLVIQGGVVQLINATMWFGFYYLKSKNGLRIIIAV
jgi:hypothetical protein